MPRKSKAQTGFEIIAVGIVAVIAGIVAVWNFLVETKLIWVVAVLIVVGIVAKVYLSRKKEQERIELIISHYQQGLHSWMKFLNPFETASHIFLSSSKQNDRVIAAIQIHPPIPKKYNCKRIPEKQWCLSNMKGIYIPL